MARHGLIIRPLDVLFFRDGKPLGEGSQVNSVPLPPPQTLAGALRTMAMRLGGSEPAMGDIEHKPISDHFTEKGTGWVADIRSRGPWFAKEAGDSAQPVLPIPANLRRDGKNLVTLCPLEAGLPGWQSPDAGMKPLWRKGAESLEKIKGGYLLSFAGLGKYLAAETVTVGDLVETSSIFGIDQRTSVAITEKLTADEGKLFSTGFVSLKGGWCLYGEFDDPTGKLADYLKKGTRVISLGGEGKRAAVTLTNPVKWPEPAIGPNESKRLTLLITPGLFDKNESNGTDEERRKSWRPTRLLEAELVAAAVSGHRTVSGWDLWRAAPKPTRFAVNEGAVYLHRKPLPDEFESAGALFCTSEAGRKDANKGWGIYLKGVWR